MRALQNKVCWNGSLWIRMEKGLDSHGKSLDSYGKMGWICMEKGLDSYGKKVLNIVDTIYGVW